MMGIEMAILILGAVTVYLLVLWTHSMRHKVGLGPFYALMGGVTAVMSLITDAGVQVHVAGTTFMVGSTVFYTALLLGVFVVYLFDGPQPARIAILMVAGLSAFVPLTAAIIHIPVTISGSPNLIPIPHPSLRINVASVLTTIADMLFLAVAWEFLGSPNFRIKLWLRAFLTLLGVMWMDVFLFSTGAFWGTSQYLSIMQGSFYSRFLVSVFASPFLYLYIQWQNSKLGGTVSHRPVFAILSEVAEIRAELGVAHREIERRKKAEKELQSAYLSLNQIMEFLPDPTLVIDKTGRVTFWNRAMTDLTGVSSDEIIGKSDYEYALPFYGERRPLLLNLALTWQDEFSGKYISVKRQDDGVLISESYHPKLKNGIFLSGTARVLFDADGAPSGAIESIRNITDIKNAEKAITESQRLSSQIIEFLPDATMVIDSSGKLIEWNQAMQNLTGIPASEIIGKSDYEYSLPFYGKRRPVMLDLVINHDELMISGYHNLRREGNKLISETYLPDFRGRGPTWLWNSAAPLYDRDNRVIGAIEAIRDISEIKISEKMLLQTEKYKAVADLAAGVAHNFNNFLQIILGNANVCLVRLKSGNLWNLEKNLSAIADTCIKASETVNRLNQFASYSEAENLENRLETFDLSLVAEEAAELTKPFWYSSSVKMGLKIDLTVNTIVGCFVEGTRSQILEVLVNLIKNAVEAMPEGGSIEIETLKETDWVVLEVRDTGLGIPAEKLGNLFNPFFTSHLGLGRGLGLATSLKIVKDHRGDITAESVVGIGSTFTVRLPMVKTLHGNT